MKKSKKLMIFGSTFFLGVVSLSCLIFSTQAGNVGNARVTAGTPKSETYWIGVQIVPVPELFLSHFGVCDESGSLAAVERVVPDSPADKAGVKRGDILLKFGEKEIHSLPDLVEQIASVKDTATELEVIRSGAKTTLTVTPAPRQEASNFQEMPRAVPFERRLPQNVFPEGRDPQMMLRQMEELFRQLQEDNGGFFLPPNIPQGFQQREIGTGKQLSVVSQTVNGKTTIKVTQVLRDGDNTEQKIWEVESIDDLPEEVREEVKVFFGQ